MSRHGAEIAKAEQQARIGRAIPQTPESAGAAIIYSEHMSGVDGEGMFRHGCRMGIEVIVSKRVDSRYKSGRPVGSFRTFDRRSGSQQRFAYILIEHEERFADRVHDRFGQLEAVQAAGETLDIQVLGLATIAPDVTPELARRTIAAIHVLGALHASPAVKAALSDRMK